VVTANNFAQEITWFPAISKYVAKSGATSVRVCTSANGVDWSDSGLITTAATTLNTIINNGTVLLATGTNGTVVTSSDAVTWTTQTTGVTESLNDAVFDAANNAIVVGNAGRIITSPSPYTVWTSRTSGTTQNLVGVVYASGDALIVAAGGRVVLTSPDVTTAFTTRYNNTSGNILGIATNGSSYVVHRIGNNMLYSPSGATSYAQYTPHSSLKAVVKGGGTYVLVGAGVFSGAALNSLVPRVAFSTAAVPTGSLVTYGGGLFVVINDNAAARSADGITWSVAAIANTPNGLAYDSANGLFIYCSGSQIIRYSSDAIIFI
jgi:hypothetical protein